jgi:hypothetical protein
MCVQPTSNDTSLTQGTITWADLLGSLACGALSDWRRVQTTPFLPANYTCFCAYPTSHPLYIPIYPAWLKPLLLGVVGQCGCRSASKLRLARDHVNSVWQLNSEQESHPWGTVIISVCYCCLIFLGGFLYLPPFFFVCKPHVQHVSSSDCFGEVDRQYRADL